MDFEKEILPLKLLKESESAPEQMFSIGLLATLVTLRRKKNIGKNNKKTGKKYSSKRTVYAGNCGAHSDGVGAGIPGTDG